jgi:hypothetical protein
VLTFKIDLMHLRGIGKNVVFPIHDHRIRFPAIPQCPTQRHILICSVVPRIMFQNIVQAEVLRGVFAGGRDKVPQDAAAGQMIERAEQASEQEGWIEGAGKGAAQADVAGDSASWQ